MSLADLAVIVRSVRAITMPLQHICMMTLREAHNIRYELRRAEYRDQGASSGA